MPNIFSQEKYLELLKDFISEYELKILQPSNYSEIDALANSPELQEPRMWFKRQSLLRRFTWLKHRFTSVYATDYEELSERVTKSTLYQEYMLLTKLRNYIWNHSGRDWYLIELTYLIHDLIKNRSSYIRSNDTVLCPVCLEDLQFSSTNLVYWLNSLDPVHDNCQGARACHFCSEVVRSNNLLEIQNWGISCVSCAERENRRCEQCNLLWYDTELVGLGDGGEWRYCRYCVSSCTDCRLYYRNGDMSVRNGDNLVCSRCSGRHVIRSHDFDVLSELDFLGYTKNGLYFGVELEVEPENTNQQIELARQVTELLAGFAIVKHDGSLHSGFEIVTAPATFDEQIKGWKKFFDADLPLISWDSTRCGMHVHFSREPISPMHLARIMVFLYSPINRDLVEGIAGRNLHSGWGERYAELSSSRKLTQLLGTTDALVDYNPVTVTHLREAYVEAGQIRYRNIPIGQGETPKSNVSFKKKRLVRKMVTSNRYTALNDTNDNTIELRIFRGTTLRSGMMKNLEFTQAMIDYCASGVISLGNLENPNHFIEFVFSNRKHYRFLAKFFEHNLVHLERKN